MNVQKLCWYVLRVGTLCTPQGDRPAPGRPLRSPLLYTKYGACPRPGCLPFTFVYVTAPAKEIIR